jgi:hypothetical protein
VFFGGVDLASKGQSDTFIFTSKSNLFRRFFSMNIRGVTLGKMAISGFLFRSLTSYNDSFARLNESIRGSMDLTNSEHRQHLLNWLNNWGCRNLSKEKHNVASGSILDWYLQLGTNLFTDETPLWVLSDNDLQMAKEAYGRLKDKTGAWRTRSQSKQEVHIGPTAASKILFALRPQALIPWDEATRVSFNCSGDPESYLKYLKTIRDLTYHIRDLCKRKGFQINELPQKLSLPNSAVITLVNEYIWITETRKVELPTSAILARWAGLG